MMCIDLDAFKMQCKRKAVDQRKTKLHISFPVVTLIASPDTCQHPEFFCKSQDKAKHAFVVDTFRKYQEESITRAVYIVTVCHMYLPVESRN